MCAHANKMIGKSKELALRDATTVRDVAKKCGKTVNQKEGTRNQRKGKLKLFIRVEKLRLRIDNSKGIDIIKHTKRGSNSSI